MEIVDEIEVHVTFMAMDKKEGNEEDNRAM